MAETASISFGVESVFGTLTGWVPNGASRNTVRTRASVVDGRGNEQAHKLHDERIETSQEFVPASATVAPTVPPNIGAVINGYVVTGISLTTSASDFVRMTLTGHAHSQNSHDSADTDSVAHGVALAKSFGAVDFLGGTAGDDAAVETGSVEISCEHTDIMDGDGDHLVGENHNPRLSGSTTWNGVPTVKAGAGWSITSDNTTEETSGYLKTEISAEKPLAFA